MSDYDSDAALDQIAEWEEERRYEQWLENDYDEYNRSTEKICAEDEKNDHDDVYTDDDEDERLLMEYEEKIDRLWMESDMKEWESYKKTQTIVFDELEKVDKVVVVSCSDIPDSNRTKSCCKYNISNRRNTILEPIEEIHSETTSTQPNTQEFTVFDHLNFVKDYVIEFWSWLFSYKI